MTIGNAENRLKVAKRMRQQTTEFKNRIADKEELTKEELLNFVRQVQRDSFFIEFGITDDLESMGLS